MGTQGCSCTTQQPCGHLEVNSFLHDPSIDSQEALAVARLLAGGQGLHGGDSRSGRGVSLRTACVSCLLRGRRVRETLTHFLWHCPTTAPARNQPDVSPIWESIQVTHLHRNLWSWRQLAIIRRTLYEMLAARRAVVVVNGKKTRRKLEEQISALWEAAE